MVPVTCEKISWRDDSKALLMTCSDSHLREVDLTSMSTLDLDVNHMKLSSLRECSTGEYLSSTQLLRRVRPC